MASNETLQKLKVLAERGDNGEKENATILLNKLCLKQGITLDDIDSIDVEMHWFRYTRGHIYDKLLQQCIYKTMGASGGFKPFKWGKKCVIGVKCTRAQSIEIELDHAFYCANFNKELERFTEAFIQSNHIFPKDVPVCKNPVWTENDRYLTMGIKKQTREPTPKHELGVGEGDD